MADPETPKNRVSSVMEDPAARAIARVYAEAFLNAAAYVGAENALEELE